uniref:Retrovirus-related Pol polyprotein from transposon TNT 1-94 n=1 Tax=Tanacetum cinerariifolium TaxID=118510 RepID=A0A6L2LLN6_TANCI|nr:hypothetical protein [Tanacetum cinerariifolium]
MNHQTLSVPQIAYQSPQVSTQPMAESPLVDLGYVDPTEDLDTYDSDCDDVSNAKAVLMANISKYGFDVFSESQMNHQTLSVPQITYQSPQVSTQPMAESPLVDLGEIMQVDSQRLLNATTIKVKDIWLGNALSLRDQGIQYDPGVPDGQAVQTIIPNNAAF